MHPSQWHWHSFVIFALSFHALAIPLAQPPTATPRRVSIPITMPNRSSILDPIDVVNEVRRSVAKIERGISAYKNNTGLDHPLSYLIGSSTKRDLRGKGTVGLSGPPNAALGIIHIGDPPSPIKVLFDTGSADFIIANNYVPNINAPFIGVCETSYLGGDKAHGMLVRENVAISGLIANDQAICAATFASSPYPLGFAHGSDGILGLAFLEAAEFGHPSVFETLYNQRKLEIGMFCFMISRFFQSLVVIGGLIDGLDPLSPNIIWVDVVQKSHWTVVIDGILVNGIPVMGSRANLVIVDTGVADLILGHSDTINEFYSYIPGHGTLPSTDDMGDIHFIPCLGEVMVTFFFGGVGFNIPYHSLVVGGINGKSGLCFGAAAVAPKFESGTLLLGIAFLENVVAIFDRVVDTRPRVGFAVPPSH